MISSSISVGGTTEKKQIYLVDETVWLDYFTEKNKGVVDEIIAKKSTTLCTLTTTLSSIVAWLLKHDYDPVPAVRTLRKVSKILPLDADCALLAGSFLGILSKRIKEFSLADTYLLAVAQKHNFKILTANPRLAPFSGTVIYVASSHATL